MYKKFFEEIEKYDTIIIHRHGNPDGDAIGSQVGLKHMILCNFPGKKVYMVGDPAGRYGFIEDSATDEVTDEVFSEALSVILDCGGENMVSDDRYRIAKATMRCDHHVFSGAFTDYEVIDTSFESCSGIIADMAMKLSLKLDETGATALFTGMVTDSGRFRYDSTTPQTFRLAAFLSELGNIDFNTLYSNLYAEDFQGLKIRSEFILRIAFTEHYVAWLYNDKDIVEKYVSEGMTVFGISRGMVGTMGDLKGVDIWVNFTESNEGVFCELRSNKYNINPVAVKYGGGGHEKASGATVPDRETAMAMLADLDRMIV